MAKATSTYKMSKDGKRYLAQIRDPHKRGAIKRTIIESELAALAPPPRRENTERRGAQKSGQNEAV